MGFRPLKARHTGQLLSSPLSGPRGPLHFTRAPQSIPSGNLYGITFYGANACPDSYQFANIGCGTVWKLDTKNNFSTLVTFTGAQNGADPYGNLTLREDVLYGDTFTGGASNLGTVFKVKTDGTGFKLLYTFTDPTLGTHPDSFLRLEIFGNMFSETRMAEKATQGLTLPAMACCSS
jgi:uncharacterized repeat protein (TIGR03803 family)